MNPSPHRHCSTCYDDETVALVYQHNQAVIEAYGYRFETPSRGS